jgi:hypothetical protein
MPSIMSLVKQKGLVIHEQVFDLDCKLKLNLQLQSKDLIKIELEKYSSVEIEIVGIY